MKKAVKLVAILMTLVLVMGMCPFEDSINVYASGILKGSIAGTGTYDNPYQIATMEDFELLRTGALGESVGDEVLCSDMYFVLTNDIYYDGTSNLSKSPVTLYECKVVEESPSIV